jgi:hypothetical protein
MQEFSRTSDGTTAGVTAMSINSRFAAAFAFAMSITLISPELAVAQDRDSREVSAYVLTESGLSKFGLASKNLAAVPGACAAENDDGDDLQSIDQMVAKLNSVPGVQAAIQSAGLTSREYVVFMFSMMQNGMAAWALKQPDGKLPPGVSQANVDFYNRHEGAMAQLGRENSCGDHAGDEDSDE